MHFIRHGQSHFNLAYDRFGCDPQIPDAGLTPQGFAQARQAARQMAGKGIRRIISSPYTRALQTASVLAEEFGVPVFVEPLAGERCLYSCDIGTPTSLLRAQWVHLDFSGIEAENWWPGLNESHAALTQRIENFTQKWGREAEADTTVVVSHWYFLSAMTGRSLDNCEIVFKQISDRRRLFP